MNCKNLKKIENGFQWTVDNNYFCTDKNGLGMWWGENTYGEQIEGACDFDLCGLTVSGARKKINRYFQDWEEDEELDPEISRYQEEAQQRWEKKYGKSYQASEEY